MPKTKIREITHQLIHSYAAALRESEKSAATIRKYVRDLTVLWDYLEGGTLTVEVASSGGSSGGSSSNKPPTTKPDSTKPGTVELTPRPDKDGEITLTDKQVSDAI